MDNGLEYLLNIPAPVPGGEAERPSETAPEAAPCPCTRGRSCGGMQLVWITEMLSSINFCYDY